MVGRLHLTSNTNRVIISLSKVPIGSVCPNWPVPICTPRGRANLGEITVKQTRGGIVNAQAFLAQGFLAQGFLTTVCCSVLGIGRMAVADPKFGSKQRTDDRCAGAFQRLGDGAAVQGVGKCRSPGWSCYQLSWENTVSTTRILLIDDEQNILDLAGAYLRQEGYEVHTASDGPGGLEAARVLKPDLIVLDIMLPGMDGLELLTRLRRESDVYVIMLTAKSEETDKIVGLSVGADDYLTKPFSPRELVARVKAALRRLHADVGPAEASVLTFRRLRIDAGLRQVWVDNEPVDLTATEFDLLQTLAEHRGRVLSREQLLQQVWGHDFYGEERVVDVHIGHIRQKLGDSRFIVTVRGVGYHFEDEEV